MENQGIDYQYHFDLIECSHTRAYETLCELHDREVPERLLWFRTKLIVLIEALEKE
jgi:hypothetical protein